MRYAVESGARLHAVVASHVCRCRGCGVRSRGHRRHAVRRPGAVPPGRVAALLRRQRREEIRAARSDQPSQRRAAADRVAAAAGVGGIPRPPIPSCASRTTTGRRRSWWAACCTPPTPSAWSRRSIRRPAGRSGRSSRPAKKAETRGWAARFARSRSGAKARKLASSATTVSISMRSTRRPARRSPASARRRASIWRRSVRATNSCGTLRRSSSATWCSIGQSMPDQDSAAKAEGEVGEVRAFDVAHRPPAVALPGDSERRRSGSEDVGERCAALHWRRQRLGADGRRRGARLRVPADVEPDERHVRRSPAGQQPLHEQRRVSGLADRPPRLAFPDGPPRSVRLRQSGLADSWRHHRRRPADPRDRPGDEAGIRVRAGPGDRPAGVADRGAAGAPVDRSGRESRGDAAVSDASRRRSIARASRSTI